MAERDDRCDGAALSRDLGDLSRRRPADILSLKREGGVIEAIGL